VVFRLIAREKPGDPETFYMMENKVSNGLFQTADADAAFQKRLDKLKQQYPRVTEWGEWRKGGVGKGADLSSGDPELPVLRVNMLEAYCFAQWVGGNLPTAIQWDAAGGRWRGGDAPFQDPHRDLKAGEVAVNRKTGPMPVGTATLDVSPFFFCRDMAGNGQEWTRTPRESADPFPPDPSGNTEYILRGAAYTVPAPYRFSLASDFRHFRDTYPVVGFRVVIEP
jgi:formylglycine-generating enzyme required for sulfatase activity